MFTTDKAFCREVALQLVEHGIESAVLCPGSRNAPLIVALAREPRLTTISVIDERSAAFIALGIALTTAKPVAIVCTSGSAILNFAPAIAEAYYRQVPLIVISADRPAEWIDQDDSQTIRQNGILSNIVKASCYIPVETGDTTQNWFVNRTINDSMLTALSQPFGPVHINIGLDIPLGNIVPIDDRYATRKITVIEPCGILSDHVAAELAKEIAARRKVLVIAGFMSPNEKLSASLSALSQYHNIAIMHEAQANLKFKDGDFSIAKIDSVLKTFSQSDKEEFLPELVITIGGSLVSRFVKKWLRSGSYSRRRKSPLQHWHIGFQPNSVDCFMSLEKRIEMTAENFFSQIVPLLSSPVASKYRSSWLERAEMADAQDNAFGEAIEWSDYAAMQYMMDGIPKNWNLQLSNGTAIRYAQLFDHGHIHRIDCNRGVSGIDGCVSTAVGASLNYGHTTILIVGDMSMQYDIAALACTEISPKLKIAVLNNCGGGIFRFIDSTADVDEREKYFCCCTKLPLKQLADGYGFAYFEAADQEQIHQAWQDFISENSRPAILNVVTDPTISADALRRYFDRSVLANQNNQ